LVERIRADTANTPAAIYSVAPEAQSYSDVLAFYLQYFTHRGHSAVAQDASVRRFFAEWQRLCRRPARIYSISLEAFVENAPEQVRQAVPTLELVAEALALTFQRILGAGLCDQGVFGASADSVRWWRSEPPGRGNLERHIERLSNLRLDTPFLDLLTGRIR